MARPQWKEAIRPRPCHRPFHLLPATSLPAALFTLDISSGNNSAQEVSLGLRVGSTGGSCLLTQRQADSGVMVKERGAEEDLEVCIPFLGACF